MQEIINEVIAGTLNTNQLLTKLHTFGDDSAKEFNALFDESAMQKSIITDLEALRVEHEKALTETGQVLKAQHEAVELQAANEKALIKNNEMLKKIAMTERNNYTVLKEASLAKDLAISTTKKELKEAKKKEKDAKALNIIKQKKIDRLMKNKPSKELPIEGMIHTVYAVNDEIFQLYPPTLTCGLGGKVQDKMVVLLFTNRNGCFITASYFDDDIIFSSWLNPDNTLAEKTLKTIENNTTLPSDEAKDFALSWLRRVNVTQKGKLTKRDTLTYRGNEL